jgi:hypothetical protein
MQNPSRCQSLASAAAVGAIAAAPSLLIPIRPARAATAAIAQARPAHRECGAFAYIADERGSSISAIDLARRQP